MEDEQDIQMDNVSLTADLTPGNPSRSRQRARYRLAIIIGVVLGLGLLVIMVAGVIAWNAQSSAEERKPAHIHQPLPPAGWRRRRVSPYGLATRRVFLQHRPPSLTTDAVRRASNAVNVSDLKSRELGPLLIPRVAGTPGSLAARTHIINQLTSLGWNVEQDTSQAWAPRPFGLTSFTNVIATVNPAVKRRLVLACHYDSKYFADGEFIGATDSALPCAQLLYLARILDSAIKQANRTNPPVTLQLLFFDGEEAFVRWTDTDSLYGARNLATAMENTPHPPGATNTNLLHGIDMFVLLDLLGVRNPSFPDYFQSTSTWYHRMSNIEQRLKRLSLTSRYNNNYFSGQQRYTSRMQDDHIPFLQRGVRVLHLIPSSFPSVWHTLADNADALDDPTISNLSKILHVFVAEYLNLTV